MRDYLLTNMFVFGASIVMIFDPCSEKVMANKTSDGQRRRIVAKYDLVSLYISKLDCINLNILIIIILPAIMVRHNMFKPLIRKL